MTDADVMIAVLDHAKGHGLVHGQLAVDLLTGSGMNRSQADAARLLANMVRAGKLRPAAKDLAGASHSVLASRSLQRLRESKPAKYPDPKAWLDGVPSEAADAHLWTFEAVREQ